VEALLGRPGIAVDIRPSSSNEPAANAGDLLRRLSVTFVWTAVGLIVIGGLNLLGRSWSISDLFFVRQDAPMLLGSALALSLLARLRLPRLPLVAAKPRTIVWALALAALALAWAGTFLVYDDFTLSMDEFMARFDAAIFSHGRLFGELPPAWTSFKLALQPIFLMPTPSPEHWSSSYLPVNAAVRALGRLAGLESLVNPLWTGLAVVAAWAVGRRLWPQAPAAAFAAAVLTAVSSQVLVNGMTAYAMPAHLALNMAWLWCFLRGGKAGHAAAIAIGFAATGLHQLIFHPLFVAPFVLQLWLDRRWAAALLYSVAYAAIGLFWASWWDIAYALMDFEGSARQMGAGGLVGRVWALVSARDLADAPLMARNLARFVAWQNPLATALFMLGGVAAFRAGGAVRALLLGILLTALAVAIILPFQGHGWGYRYLHGLIGSACLIAGWTWSRLTAGLAPGERGKAGAAFAAVAVLSLLVALPVHAWQAHRFLAPYARASAEIAGADADVVAVDEAGIWYGADLVRNDPFLANRPVVVRLAGLGKAQRKALCTRGRVALFDREDAAAAGIALTGAAVPSKARTPVSRSLAPGCPL
jgi:hypothetical protein